MSDASRRGRRNRRAGHAAEREVANRMTDEDTFGCVVVTCRSVTGGTQIGGDLCTIGPDGYAAPLPYVIEVKYEQRFRPEIWLGQAREAARGRPYFVVWKQPNKPLNHAFVIEPDRDFVWRASWLKYWVPLEAAA